MVVSEGERGERWEEGVAGVLKELGFREVTGIFVDPEERSVSRAESAWKERNNKNSERTLTYGKHFGFVRFGPLRGADPAGTAVLVHLSTSIKAEVGFRFDPTTLCAHALSFDLEGRGEFEIF